MKAVIWSKDQCPYCDQAKLMFDMKGIEYEEKKIGLNATKEELLAVVPSAKSVPQIFINEEYIGGITELREKLKHVN